MWRPRWPRLPRSSSNRTRSDAHLEPGRCRSRSPGADPSVPEHPGRSLIGIASWVGCSTPPHRERHRADRRSLARLPDDGMDGALGSLVKSAQGVTQGSGVPLAVSQSSRVRSRTAGANPMPLPLKQSKSPIDYEADRSSSGSRRRWSRLRDARILRGERARGVHIRESEIRACLPVGALARGCWPGVGDLLPQRLGYGRGAGGYLALVHACLVAPLDLSWPQM